MIEQINVQNRPGQAAQYSQTLVDNHGQPNDFVDLEALTDQELQCAFLVLSVVIEALRPIGAKLSLPERLSWEITVLKAMYQRESIQFELIHRSLDKLDQSLAAQRERQDAFSSSLTQELH